MMEQWVRENIIVQLIWDLVATDTTSAAGYTKCIFQVSVSAQPQLSGQIVDDGTCSSMFQPSAFGYAIDDSVPGYEGIDILMYATGSLDMTGNIVLQQFYPWFSDMSASQLSASPFQNTIEYDSNTGSFLYARLSRLRIPLRVKYRFSRPVRREKIVLLQSLKSLPDLRKQKLFVSTGKVPALCTPQQLCIWDCAISDCFILELERQGVVIIWGRNFFLMKNQAIIGSINIDGK